MRLGVLFLLLWGASLALAADDGLGAPADETTAESALAEQPLPRQLAVRLRCRGPRVDASALTDYSRVSWRGSDGQELFLVTERDPAEARLDDYVTVYATVAPPGRGWSMTAGDVRPGWATGLVLGRSRGPSGVPSHPGQDADVVGWRSTAENQSVRGLALRGQGTRARWAVLLGQGRWDARLDSLGQVVSLPTSGLHVSATERAGRDQLALEVAAGRLAACAGGWTAGVSLAALSFGRPLDLRRAGRAPWGFHGQGLRLFSLDIDGHVKGCELRGEAALDHRGQGAQVLAVRRPCGRWRARVLGRWRHPGFYSPLGNTAPVGERSLLMAAERVRTQLFVDLHNQAAAAQSGAGAAGWSAGGAARWPGLRGGVLALRLEAEGRVAPGPATGQRLAGWRGALGFDAAGRAQPAWHLGLAQRTWRRGPGITCHGSLVSAHRQLAVGRLQLWVQGACFRTDGYYGRLYESERDLPGLASLRALYGHGGVLGALASWSIGPALLSLRGRWQSGDAPGHLVAAQVDVSAGW